jgi:hypothetical protein
MAIENLQLHFLLLKMLCYFANKKKCSPLIEMLKFFFDKWIFQYATNLRYFT